MQVFKDVDIRSCSIYNNDVKLHRATNARKMIMKLEGKKNENCKIIVFYLEA